MSYVGVPNFHDNCLLLPPFAAAAVPVGRAPGDPPRPVARHHVEVELWKLQTNAERKEGRREAMEEGGKERDSIEPAL